MNVLRVANSITFVFLLVFYIVPEILSYIAMAIFKKHRLNDDKNDIKIEKG